MIMNLGKKSDQRADLVAVVKRASELGDRITPKAVCNDLINRPDALAAGERILHRCANLGLLDGRYELTEAGHQAAEEEIVFLPEHGVYQLWFTNDSLVTQGFLGYNPRRDEKLFDEVRNKSQKKQEPFGPTPAWTDHVLGKELTNYGNNESVKIYSVEAKCRLVSKHGLSVTATLLAEEFQRPRIILSSLKWGNDAIIDVPEELTFDEIWNDLLSRNSLKWETEFLEVSFDDLSNRERYSFKRPLKFDHPEIERYGAFDGMTVDDVPIAPRSKKDAREWARFLLEDSIKGYLTPERYQALVTEIEQKPGFYKYSEQLELPELATLAEQMRKKDGRMKMRNWFLRAPLDLFPMEVK